MEELRQEYMYNLLVVINELGLKRQLVDEYSKLFNAKRASVNRQLNRILAYIEGREIQSRSGRREKEKWIASAEKILRENGIDPERFRVYADTSNLPPQTFRTVYFSTAMDAYKYSMPIPRGISQIRYNRKKKVYEVEISSKSDVFFFGPYEP